MLSICICWAIGVPARELTAEAVVGFNAREDACNGGAQQVAAVHQLQLCILRCKCSLTNNARSSKSSRPFLYALTFKGSHASVLWDLLCNVQVLK